MELIRTQLIILFRKYQMHISNAWNVMDVNSVNSWFNLYTAGHCEWNQGFISESLRVPCLYWFQMKKILVNN